MSSKFDRILWFPLWPTLLAFYHIWLFSERGPSTMRIIGATVIALWFFGAWCNAFTRGRLVAWMNADHDDDPLPEIPTSYAAYAADLDSPSLLQQAIADGLAGRRDLADAIRDLELSEIDSADDATAVVVALEDSFDNNTADWRDLTPLLGIPGSSEIYTIFYHQALPVLLRLFRDNSREPEQELVDDLLLAIRQFTAYGYSPAFRDIAAASRDPRLSESSWWELIVRAANDEDPDAIRLMETLAEPLPENFAGVAYLDWCNQWSIEGVIPCHPFDTDPGVTRLHHHLTDPDPDHATHAISAAAATAFLKHPDRDRLLELARNHSDPPVRLEASWAMARLRIPGGDRELAAATLDWRIGRRAVEYLEELDLQELVPADALTPRHSALADMADWLAQPNELGRPPETLAIIDQRELFWPAAGKRELQTLFRWKLGKDEGACWTGSSTWILFSQARADQPVLDLYAMYHSWHMAATDHPDAPESFTDLVAGHRILTNANPGQNWTAQP